MIESKISRREFTASGLTLLSRGRSSAAVVRSDLAWRKLRQKLAHRQRRLIYNDDSDEILLPAPARSEREFLSRRFDWIKNSQVDSYYWCVGDGQDLAFGRVVPHQICDTAGIMLRAARSAGLEGVLSVRMNDIHDAFLGVNYPFKLQHRDMLLDPSGAPGKYDKRDWRYWFWSGMNYAYPEVREHKLAFIGRICEEYFPDGVELDFMRHNMYFKKGEEAANIPAMTDFVRRVRTKLDEIGRKRGRPIVLATRLADTPEKSMQLGLDSPTWLKEGLLDVLIAGQGFAPWGGAWKKYAELAETYDVPLYPAFDGSMIYHFPKVELMRGAAMSFWYNRASGIYLFNPFFAVDTKTFSAQTVYGDFKRIGSPTTLVGVDKAYRADSIRPGLEVAFTWSSTSNADMPLPVQLSEVPAAVPLEVGEDFSSSPVGRRRELRLRLQSVPAYPLEMLRVRLNNLSLSNGETTGDGWVEFPIDCPPLRSGTNQVSVASLNGKGTVQAIEVWVRYVPS